MAEENQGSLKREHRIDSSDAARPAAQLNDEPRYFAGGLKPKTRIIKTVEYTVLDEKVFAGKGKKPLSMILRTVTYDDGITVDTTVGEDNEGYQQFLIDGANLKAGKSGSTRLRTQPRKPSTPKKG